MKVLIFIAFLFAGVASGQISNVSIGADPLRPTLVNHSGKPIIGYQVQRITSNGVNSTFFIVDIDSIATGELIQPEEERSIGPFSGTPIAIALTSPESRGGHEGEPVGYKLMAVLFADGTVYGPSFVRFQRELSVLRRIGLLNVGDLENPKGEFHSAVAKVILKIRDEKGESEASVALRRFASLPEVTTKIDR
jgi:hypothetical protein